MNEADKPKTEDTKPEAPAEAPASTGAAKKKDNTKTIVIVVAAVVFVVVVIPIILLTIGAGILGNKIAKDVQISGNGDSATIKTKNGDEISTGGASQTLPKDFPDSVSTYEGTIVTSSRLTLEGRVTWSVVIETKDDATKVGEALSKSFSTNGWTASLDNKTNEGGLIAAKNGVLHTQVLYTEKAGKTSISYTVVPIATQ